MGNPPYHEGKAGSRAVIEDLCERAGGWLGSGGRLVLVVQQASPLGRMLESRFHVSGVRAENASYRVWEASRPR